MLESAVLDSADDEVDRLSHYHITKRGTPVAIGPWLQEYRHDPAMTVRLMYLRS